MASSTLAGSMVVDGAALRREIFYSETPYGTPIDVTFTAAIMFSVTTLAKHYPLIKRSKD
jgi:hypothetical protein